MEMELCGTLYRERFSAEAAPRISKVLVVFAAFLIMAAGVYTGRRPVQGDKAPDAGNAVYEAGNGMSETADITWLPSVMPVPETADVNERDTAVPVNRNITAEDVPVYPESDKQGDASPVMTAEDSMNISAVPPAEQHFGTSESTISGEAGNTAADTGMDGYEGEETDPEAVIPPESPAGPPAGVVNGFLVNDTGMIYGVADPALIAADEYLELPSEGCTGIAAGTFAAGFPEVREMRIPSNITYIEEGAFSGLSNIEWYEMAPSGEYYAEQGILYSENGSCILAFPAGRTGTYKVPSHVERFAAGAFDGSQLETIDAAACPIIDSTGLPEDIELLVRETP